MNASVKADRAKSIAISCAGPVKDLRQEFKVFTVYMLIRNTASWVHDARLRKT